MINPIQSNQANAIPIDTDSGSGGDGSGDITPSISLAIEGDTNQTTNVTAGEVAYRTNVVKVSANQYSTFSVLLSSMNGYGSELHGKDNPTATINGVGTNITTSNFGNNTWGYAITENLTENSEESLNYSSVPNYSDGAKIVASYEYQNESEWASTKDYKLAFAAKIGGDSPADHYVTQVALSVIGTPGEILKGFELIDTMQEMTAAVCNDSDIGDTVRLRDTRDSKVYWIAKLADGNCWMTQNLDFDIPSTLKSSDTNVPADRTISATKYTNSTGVHGWSYSNASHISYYDPGIILKIDPATVNSCGDKDVTDITNSSCKTAGWLDVSSGYTAKTTAPQGNDQSDTSSRNSVLSGITYDAHYLLGNYYSWNAATAGIGSSTGSTAGTQVSGSICPKGWKLPISGESLSRYPTLTAGSLNSYTDDVNGSFAYLYKQYGLATAFNSGNVSANGYNIYDAPLYGLRAGRIFPDGSSGSAIFYAGARGYLWSSTVSASNGAYVLYFGEGATFQASSSGARFYGFNIRCVNDPSI